MKDKNNNQDCSGLQNCRGCIMCNNSTRCDNSTGCNNCAYCIYCSDLTLEKFAVFNKSLKDKKSFMEVRDKIVEQLRFYKHPKNLSEQDIDWLKKNVKQFDQKVLDNIMADSILPDKPKELK